MQIDEKIIKDLVDADPETRKELDLFKRRVSEKYKIPYPGNIDLIAGLKSYKDRTPVKLLDLLRKRPIRSLSGIVNVSVLTKPYPCPGSCLYCPNEPGFPKSYLSGEPAAERAKRLKFDPYLQVAKRIETLAGEGHPTDKIELRVIGGTWSHYPKTYQNRFIANCFKACNDCSKKTTVKRELKPLEAEQKTNESAKCRIIGLSVETRPDFINEGEIKQLRKLGVTKVELGVQSIYDDVLEQNKRGHSVEATIRATALLKNSGFKISYQVMLNLPGSNPARDIAMMKEIFSNPNFQPDLLKIYPCSVVKEAPLYALFEAGKFRPYSETELIETIKRIKKEIPPYVRIERIIRDIPSPRIAQGSSKISNLRQIIEQQMKEEKWNCQCVRCREVKGEFDAREKPFLVRRDYAASGGREIFLSYENKNRTKIFSLLRLRIPDKNIKTILPVLQNSALIREIHTYGLQVPISKKTAAPQHQGMGMRLIKEAETIAKKESGFSKIAAISGIGARNYWRKSGYKLSDTYMVKTLHSQQKSLK